MEVLEQHQMVHQPSMDLDYDNSLNYGKKNEVTESCPEFNAE